MPGTSNPIVFSIKNESFSTFLKTTQTFKYMNKHIIFSALITLLSQVLSCKSDEIVLATNGKDKIYQSQIDSMIVDEVERIRENALEIKIMRLIFENEAKKRHNSIEELRQSEIFDKSKKIQKQDIESFAKINNISMADSANIEFIKEQLKLINRRNRYEVFIDSLKRIDGMKVVYNFSHSVINSVSKLYSHSCGNKSSKTNVFIIADYDCSSCKEKYGDIYRLFSRYLDKIQLHFVYYSLDISKKAILAEAIAKQGKFWEANESVFNLKDVNDIVLDQIATQFNLDYRKLKKDFENSINENLLVNNQKIFNELNIPSVPAFIIDDEILTGYYDPNKLVQIINYKIINN